MKVLHILAQLPIKTGSGVYFSNVIEGLKQYPELEQACIYGTTNEYEFDILNKANQYEVIFETEELPFPIVGMSDIMPYPNTLYKEMTDDMMTKWKNAFISKLTLAKERFNPDVIITHHLWILSSIVREFFFDKKVIAVCHNTDIRQAEQNMELTKKHILNLKDVDRVLALNTLQFSDIENLFGIQKTKIVNIGAGYNDKLFFPLDDYNKRQDEINTNNIVNLIYAGKFDDSKGFYELIKAFKLLEQKDNNITLDLIGNINEKNLPKIEKIVDTSKNIRIYNTINQLELANIMRTKDIFILPSYFEGLGLIAVEALGSGLRVVATKIDGLMELLGEEINNTDIIDYIDMPTIYDTDKAVEEEKPAFVLRLANSIENMISVTRKNRNINKDLLQKVAKHSWKNKVENIKKYIVE